MGQQGRKPFTDEELAQFVADPKFTPGDLQLLSPDETTRLQAVQDRKAPLGVTKDVLTGVGKGAVDTAVDYGSIVHRIPLVGDLTDKLSKMLAPMLGGDSKTDPNAAFANKDATKKQLGITGDNTAQNIGMGVEKAGEFFVPAGASRLAITKGLVGLIPDSASPGAVQLANRFAAHAGRILGEAASATGVAASHGDDNPLRAGAIAGGATAGAEELAPMALRLMKTSKGKEIAPLLLAIATMKGLGGVTPEGLGAGFGVYHLVKGMSDDAVTALTKAGPKPFTVGGAAPEAMYGLGSKVGEAGAAAESATDTKTPQPNLRRRRIQEMLTP